jgi:hypothetical protein
MSVTFLPHKGWQLTQPLNILVDEGWVEIPAGFICDLSSIPWPIAWLPGFHCYSFGIEAPSVHDWLYQHGGIIDGIRVTRKRADQMYRNLAQARGVGKIRAWTAYVMLRGFGWFAWRSMPKRERALWMAQ